ncbi:DUF4307 domain-containing protein [Streptomyces sp. NPDC060194]|uniref:DUF4307 domain-containing protein n=1 Tax=Streptomyces sp. NPDC060194 TaxID=3347069 RepID=UPI003658E933
MSTQRETPPAGRYGAPADARADHRLKRLGLVLGVLFLAVLGWIGYHYVSGERALSAQIVTFDAVSDSRVEIELDVTKSTGTAGTCTVRALDEFHGEVGRKDVRFASGQSVSGLTVDLRTTARATSAELVGCARRDS